MSISRTGTNLPNRNRIPKIWSNYMLANYYSDFVVPVISNHDYEGEISKVGDTVIIQKRLRITSFTGVVGEDLQEQTTVTDDAIQLSIDYFNYFNAPISDVDAFQSQADYATEVFDEGSRALGVSVEDQILQSIYSSANSTVTCTQLSQNNALSVIHAMALALNQKKLPQRDRWLVIDPITAFFLGLSDLKADYITNDGSSSLRSGTALAKPIAGFTVYMSTELLATNSTSKILAGHMDALTFASQITRNELVRNPNQFGDKLRGMITYGYKVAQPDALVYGNIQSFASQVFQA